MTIRQVVPRVVLALSPQQVMTVRYIQCSSGDQRLYWRDTSATAGEDGTLHSDACHEPVLRGTLRIGLSRHLGPVVKTRSPSVVVSSPRVSTECFPTTLSCSRSCSVKDGQGRSRAPTPEGPTPRHGFTAQTAHVYGVHDM